MNKFKLILISCVLTLFATTAFAQSGGSTIDLSDVTTTSGDGWSYASSVWTIQDGANVTVSGSVISRRIVVATNATATITLNGVTIDHSSYTNLSAAPITVSSGATLTLILQGTNTLKGGSGYNTVFAGLNVVGVSTTSGGTPTVTTQLGTLIISEESTGDLTAVGGSGARYGAAGIGGQIGSTSNYTDRGVSANGQGNIIINGGTITATGGNGTDARSGGGAGIGTAGDYSNSTASQGGMGYSSVFSGSITINGGTITATGGTGAGTNGGSGSNAVTYGGAGIGSGGARGNLTNGTIGYITINNGTITATGSNSGSGIGSGGCFSTVNQYYPLRINGGLINATGGDPYYGIRGHQSLFYMGSLTGSGNGTGDTEKSGIYILSGIAGSWTNTTGMAGQVTRGIVIITTSSNSNIGVGTHWRPDNTTETTLSGSMTLPAGITLTIPADRTLVIPRDVTFTNNGTIVNNGTIKVCGGGTFTKGANFSGNEPETIACGIDISAATVTLSANSIAYGQANPTVASVTLGGTPLAASTDYTWAVTTSTGTSAAGKAKVGTVTITVTGTGEYSGTKTATYTITAKPLTWNTNGTVQAKEYNGTQTATVATQPSLNGVEEDDVVTVTSGTVQFNNANAGTGKTITASGFGITGTDAGNYSISGQPDFASGTINKKTITITPTASQTMVYGTTPTFTYSNTALIGADQITGSLGGYAEKNVGTHPFTLGTLTAGDNYTLELANVNFTITQATGSAVSTPTEVSVSGNNITVSATLATATGQTVEYSINGGAWQDSPTFTGLTPNTSYSIIARSKANTNYAAGTPSAALDVTTSNPQPPAIATTTLANGTVGTAYSVALEATGDHPIEWEIASGNLPSGLTLSTAGVISGTPTANGTFDFTVKATNNVGNNTKALSIVINKSAAQIAEEIAQENANEFKTTHAAILGKTVGTVAIADKTAVTNALTAYNALSTDAKALLADEKALLDALATKIGELEATPIRISQIATANSIAAINNGLHLTATTGATVRVYDVRGKGVLHTPFAPGAYNISLNHLPNGVYIASVEFGNREQKTVRIVVR